MNMIGAIVCALSFITANFGVEFFKDYPNYSSVGLVSWHQTVAIAVYYFIWVRPELKDARNVAN
jgi:hypothetical protein